MAGGGTEQSRMRHLIVHLDHLEDPLKPLPHPIKRGQRRGSFNHEFLLRVGLYADRQPGAQAGMVEWLQGQEEEGHCVRGGAVETFSASHGQLNEAAAGVGLLLAVTREERGVADLFRRWWWSELALCAGCEVPGSLEQPWKKGLVTVWGPGWRAMRGKALAAHNSCRDLCYRLVWDADVPLREKLVRDKFNLAFRALLELPAGEAKTLIPPAGWVPPLPYPFRAARWRSTSAFAAAFEVPGEHPDIAIQAGRDQNGELYVRTTHGEVWAPGATEWIADYPRVARKTAL